MSAGIRWWVAAMALGASAAMSGMPAFATSYLPPEGVSTNLLVKDGRVVFGQAFGVITMLDLETGEVVARREGLHAWNLWRVPEGILVRSPVGMRLLDPETLAERRQTPDTVGGQPVREWADRGAQDSGAFGPGLITQGWVTSDPVGRWGAFGLRVSGQEPADGHLTIRRADGPGTDSWSAPVEVRFTRPSEFLAWAGRIDYLKFGRQIVVVAQAGDRILLGSSGGHLECLDARTGASQWLYIFPAEVRGGPPDMARARHFRRLNRERARAGGLVLEGETSVREGWRRIADPRPARPFRWVSFLYGLTWVAVMLASGLGWLGAWGWTEWGWGARTGAGLGLAGLAVGAGALFGFRQMSGETTFALCVAILPGLVATWKLFEMLASERRLVLAFGLLLLAVVMAGLGVLAVIMVPR